MDLVQPFRVQNDCTNIRWMRFKCDGGLLTTIYLAGVQKHLLNIVAVVHSDIDADTF
jgi:hypothetical protein